MKKFLSFFVIAITVAFCLVSCDTDCNASITESEKKTNPPPKGVSVATINVTVNITKDVTMDELFQAQFSYGTGEYEKGISSFDATKKIKKADMSIVKNDDHSGTVKFKIEDDGLVDEDFYHFFYLKFVNSKNKTAATLKEVYQDDTIFTKKTVKDLTLTIDGIYGEINVDLK